MLIVNKVMKKYFEDTNNTNALEAMDLLEKEMKKAERELVLKQFNEVAKPIYEKESFVVSNLTEDNSFTVNSGEESVSLYLSQKIFECKEGIYSDDFLNVLSKCINVFTFKSRDSFPYDKCMGCPDFATFTCSCVNLRTCDPTYVDRKQVIAK